MARPGAASCPRAGGHRVSRGWCRRGRGEEAKTCPWPCESPQTPPPLVHRWPPPAPALTLSASLFVRTREGRAAAVRDYTLPLPPPFWNVPHNHPRSLSPCLRLSSSPLPASRSHPLSLGTFRMSGEWYRKNGLVSRSSFITVGTVHSPRWRACSTSRLLACSAALDPSTVAVPPTSSARYGAGVPQVNDSSGGEEGLATGTRCLREAVRIGRVAWPRRSAVQLPFGTLD